MKKLFLGLLLLPACTPALFAEEAAGLSSAAAALATAQPVASVSPVPSPSPSPTAAVSPVAAAAVAPISPASFAAAAVLKVDGELALLDGGPLSLALAQTAREGRQLRLLLDPEQRSTRLQGLALAGLSATAQVRWKPRAGKRQRRLLADGVRLLTWSAGYSAEATADPGLLALAQQRFERLWSGAQLQLPESQRLDDALKALPDPTESDPHFIRRREASGE